MSSDYEDHGKENTSEDLLTNHVDEREVSNSRDVDRLLHSERETSLDEEPAAENDRDLPSDRGEIVSLKENDIIEKRVQQDGEETEEQSSVDKTDLESRNEGNTSGEQFDIILCVALLGVACSPPLPERKKGGGEQISKICMVLHVSITYSWPWLLSNYLHVTVIPCTCKVFQ